MRRPAAPPGAPRPLSEPDKASGVPAGSRAGRPAPHIASQGGLRHQTHCSTLTRSDRSRGAARGRDWRARGRGLAGSRHAADSGRGTARRRALRAGFPDHPIVADLKTMDGGYLEAEMMAKAGASMSSSWASPTRRPSAPSCAPPATTASGHGRHHGRARQGRLRPDAGGQRRRLILVHTGFDERHEQPGLSPLDDLPAITPPSPCPCKRSAG